MPMPKRFDLLKLDFINPKVTERNTTTSEIYGLAYAPVYAVKVGDIVDTGFIRGLVVQKIGFCDRDDEFIKLIADFVQIVPVAYKLDSIKYEDDLD